MTKSRRTLVEWLVFRLVPMKCRIVCKRGGINQIKTIFFFTTSGGRPSGFRAVIFTESQMSKIEVYCQMYQCLLAIQVFARGALVNWTFQSYKGYETLWSAALPDISNEDISIKNSFCAVRGIGTLWLSHLFPLWKTDETSTCLAKDTDNELINRE